MTTYNKYPSGQNCDGTEAIGPIRQNGQDVSVTVAQILYPGIAASGLDASNAVVYIGGSSTKRTISGRFGEFVSVKDFGADSTGTKDSTDAFVAAIATGLPVYVPSGTYLISGAIQIPSNTVIFGVYKLTRIILTSATSDLFQIGTGSQQVNNVLLQDLLLYSSVVKTSGDMVNAKLVQDFNLFRVWCGSFEDYTNDGQRIFNGIVVSGFATCSMFGGGILGARGDGLTIAGTSNGLMGAEFNIDFGVVVANCSGKGVRIGGGAGGVYLGEMNVETNGIGLFVDTALAGGTTNREIFLSSCITDSNINQNVWFTANSTAFVFADLIWGCGNQTAGVASIQIDQTSGNFVFDKVACYTNKSHGLLVNGGNVQIGSGLFNGNGSASPGGSGIYMGATGLGLQISLFEATGCGAGGAGYAIDFSASTGTYNVTGGDARNNTSGTLNLGASSGVNQYIGNVLGFVGVNEGSFTIPSGQSSLTVNHGISGTPSAVMIWPYGPVDNGQWYVDNTSINGTTFTAHNGMTAGANRSFGFRAVRNQAS